MINRIDIVSIPVSDQNRAKAFYVEKLGFKVKAENPMGPDQTWVQLELPGAETSVTLVTWFDAMPPGSMRGMVLDCEDIAKAHADLKAKGVEIKDIDVLPWGSFATFEDPDGNGLVLQQAQGG